MDDARNVPQTRQDDVDDEVGAAATLKEDSERWQEDGEEDLDDVAAAFSLAMTPRASRRRRAAYLPVKGMMAFGFQKF